MSWVQRENVVASEPPMAMPLPIWQICSSRGYKTTAELDQLFQPKLKNLTHPFAIHDMEPAVQRLLEALREGEMIGLYGDYDLDGSPGLALIQEGLKVLGFQNLKSLQPSRMRDGYGFHKHLVDQFILQKVKLIITVDVGITDIVTVDYAKSHGVDVIITDHHLPKDELPKAHAILNPNKGHCESSLGHLCGTGVAFYFLLALKMEMEKQNLLKSDVQLKDLLDLFALATITDMVPLVHENRTLVKHGLVQLENTKRQGLRLLLSELGFAGKKLRSQDVAFRIAPKLNALTRLDEGVRAFDVLTADEKTASKLVEETLLINQRRVQFQEQARGIVEKLVQDADKSKFLFLCSHEFHPGVISLVASDLMSRYGVPALIGAIGEDGRVVGSARSPSDNINLQNVLQAASDGLVKFGGHAVAAGFEMAVDKKDHVQDLLQGYFSSQTPTDAATSALSTYDLELQMADITPSLVRWLDSMGPFGVQFEAPRFLLRNVVIKKLRHLKGNYLKYTLVKDGMAIDAPWFKGSREFPEGTQVDILFEPQINDFRGESSVQLLLHDMRSNA